MFVVYCCAVGVAVDADCAAGPLAAEHSASFLLINFDVAFHFYFVYVKRAHSRSVALPQSLPQPNSVWACERVCVCENVCDSVGQVTKVP